MKTILLYELFNVTPEGVWITQGELLPWDVAQKRAERASLAGGEVVITSVELQFQRIPVKGIEAK